MRRVLLVDDEPDVAPLVALCLDPLGVDVVLAEDLADALEVAEQAQIGLVLLDLALRVEDGLEILPRLREDPHLQGVPVVAFTAHDSRRREAFERGVDSFLARPFTSGELQSMVEGYLG